ncbi:MAG TPA: hypothetical protein V6C85_12345 [Allocoleopsis sp.]
MDYSPYLQSSIHFVDVLAESLAIKRHHISINVLYLLNFCDNAPGQAIACPEKNYPLYCQPMKRDDPL